MAAATAALLLIDRLWSGWHSHTLEHHALQGQHICPCSCMPAAYNLQNIRASVIAKRPHVSEAQLFID